MAFEPRKTLLVDHGVQGALIARAVGYCLLSMLFAAVGYIAWQIYVDQSRPISAVVRDSLVNLAPALIALLFALPFVILDCLRVTNRFVGPLFRLRRYLRRIAQGESVEPIMFRTHDFWHEIAEEFNAAVARLERDKLAAARGDKPAAQPSLYPIEIE